MIQLRDDGTIRALFGMIKERAEILNEDGSLLGYYEPANSEEDEAYRQAGLLFASEKIVGIEPELGSWHTTAEVLERLHSFEKSDDKLI